MTVPVEQLTADDRIRKVAAFVAEHFRESVDPLGYKAFLVGVNREACAGYKQALDELLPAEWTEAVYTDNPNDSVERPLVVQHQLSPWCAGCAGRSTRRPTRRRCSGRSRSAPSGF